MQKYLTNKNTINKIYGTLDLHKDYKGSYFWYPNKNNDWDRNFDFKLNGDIYKVEQSCYNSCKNVYYSLYITKNGEKIDIRGLKKLLKEGQNPINIYKDYIKKFKKTKKYKTLKSFDLNNLNGLELALKQKNYEEAKTYLDYIDNKILKKNIIATINFKLKY